MCAIRQPANEGKVGNYGFPSTEQANYVNNFQRNNNPYSNTYTPAWRNHPNLRWGGNKNHSAPRANNFQARPPPPPQEKKPSLEETMQQLTATAKTFKTTTNTNLKNQAAAIHNLEVQMSQIFSLLSNRPQGSLPSNTEINSKEHVKAIMLRSKKVLAQDQVYRKEIPAPPDSGDENSEQEKETGDLQSQSSAS